MYHVKRLSEGPAEHMGTWENHDDAEAYINDRVKDYGLISDEGRTLDEPGPDGTVVLQTWTTPEDADPQFLVQLVQDADQA